MNISLISALTYDHVIGLHNTIPWHLSHDMLWFKKHTLNKPIIMGRKTFQSIHTVLPLRKNIVLSRNPQYTQNATWVTTPDQAIAEAGQSSEIMVIGGGEIFNIFLPHAQRLYLTYININISGDTYFPHYIHHEWHSIYQKFHNADEKNNFDYYFIILERY